MPLAGMTIGPEGVGGSSSASYMAEITIPPPTGDTSGVLDKAMIQTILNAAPIGSRVNLSNNGNDYYSNGQILVPPQIAFWGQLSTHIDRPAVAIKATSGFSATSLLGFVDQTTGGYSVVSAQQNVFYITLDLSAVVSTTVDGLNATGYVHGVTISDVQIYSPPNHGVSESSNGSGNPYSWRFIRTNITQGGKFGFSWATTDSSFEDCEVIGGANIGWNFGGSAANTILHNCRSEFNLVGYAFTGTWASGTGSGGMQFTDCSTDANVQDGVRITATGGGFLLISGLRLRRDGRNGGSGGGSYAGLNMAGSTIPVIMASAVCTVGVSDDGTGTPSPQYGLSLTGTTTNLTLGVFYFQGNTAGLHDDGTNTYWPGAGQYASGTTSSPVVVPGFGLLAHQVTQTAINGVAKINGTQTFATYAVPNDGRVHTVTYTLGENVTSVNETGGICSAIGTFLGQVYTNDFMPQQNIGLHGASLTLPCDPGTTASITQRTALTAGGPTTVQAALVAT